MNCFHLSVEDGSTVAVSDIMINRGGQAILYLGTFSNSFVAVKKYTNQVVDRLKERHMLSKLLENDFRHMIQEVKWGVDPNDDVFLVMPLLKYDLLDKIEVMDVACRVEMTFTLVRAVQDLHLSGIVHGDIKLENVGETAHGDLVLFDWCNSSCYPYEKVRTYGSKDYTHPDVRHRMMTRLELDVWALTICMFCVLFKRIPSHEGKFLMHGEIERAVWNTARQSLTNEEILHSNDLICDIVRRFKAQLKAT